MWPQVGFINCSSCVRSGQATKRGSSQHTNFVKVLACLITRYNDYMKKALPVLPYVVVMVVIIVSIDVLFFRQRFWERLLANMGIVLLFAAFYLRFQA